MLISLIDEWPKFLCPVAFLLITTNCNFICGLGYGADTLFYTTYFYIVRK